MEIRELLAAVRCLTQPSASSSSLTLRLPRKSMGLAVTPQQAARIRSVDRARWMTWRRALMPSLVPVLAVR